MKLPLIQVTDLYYVYGAESPDPIPALSGVDLVVNRGQHVAVVGHNGSGKSTLAKCLNGLLRPSAGTVLVKGQSTAEQAALIEIRRLVGMVFQDPDNQFVATTVEEEIAFGPENLGVPAAELRIRVDRALEQCGLSGMARRNPRLLSAGAKSRLAVASVLAAEPACIVLDEATALLDPVARYGLRDLVADLVASGIAVVSITHHMDDAALADHVYVLDRGRVALEGEPDAVFAQTDRLGDLGLDRPVAAEIAARLAKRGLPVSADVVTTPALVAALVGLGAAHE